MSDTVWRSEDIAPEDAVWAMSEEGRRVLADLLAGPSDADPLATASWLRARGLAGHRAATVQGVATASLRARSAGHPPSTWWTPAAAEQASHPAVAAWRAQRYGDVDAVDLTAGCGGDTLALAEVAGAVVAVERSASRVPFLRANLGDDTVVCRGDALRPPLNPSRWWGWADPARRADGRRLRGLGALVPSVPGLTSGGWAGLGVAVAPGVDLDDPDRPADAELEFVQVERTLVEASLWLGATRDTGPGERATASATLLPEGAHVRGTPTPPDVAVVEPSVGAWLAEPAPALVRARLVDQVAGELGLSRLARHRALFVGERGLDTAWFRLEVIEAVVPARPRAVRDALRGLDALPLEIVTHGIGVDVPGWWRGLGSPERGPQGRALHLARLDHSSVAVLTRRAPT